MRHKRKIKYTGNMVISTKNTNFTTKGKLYRLFYKEGITTLYMSDDLFPEDETGLEFEKKLRKGTATYASKLHKLLYGITDENN